MSLFVFKDVGFKYEPYLCIGCHGLMQKAVRFNDVAIVYIKGSAYRIHFWYMSKNDAINIVWLIKWEFYNFFFVIYKKWITQLIIKEQKSNTK